MSTKYSFPQDTRSAVTFNPTLDGETYTAKITWNVFGQRWYLSIYDSSLERILTTALIGTPSSFDLNLLRGYFTTTMVYRKAAGIIEVSD